ncbi:sigma factor-like helix-turn-helix DNA-binding protein [Streptomyces mirabilis]|uniref:sigma factor-like helix-turn-helix DNA-binding protein n=1 Tax=Streptomyces mirabilis TaxID=68239 RepID=UPI00352FCC7D
MDAGYPAARAGALQRHVRDAYLRPFGGMRQAGIAEQLGISQMRVSRLISLRCDRLRDQVMRGAA